MSDVVLKTIIAEAGGDPAAMAAVAAVIHNRAVTQGKTPEQIVKARGQFEGYSNPGPASIRAQNDPKVIARASQVWSGIKSGSIADPTNGAVMYHADSIKPYWAKSANKNGTVNIGGNVFYKGTASPQTALAAIDQVAPNPQSRPPSLAYANTPTSVRALTVNPDGSPADFASALSAKLGLNFTPSAKTDEAVTGMKRPPQVPQVAALAPGMIAPGNINLNNRPVYFGNDGSYGTERSFSIGTDKGEVLIPQIVNGRLLSQPEAIKHYQQTGQNLGTFATPAAADAYAVKTHNRDQGLGNLPVPMPGRPPALGVASIPQSLVSHPVQTLRIDPLTNRVIEPNAAPSLLAALNAKADRIASGQEHFTTTAAPPVVPRASNVAPPIVKTVGQAGNVALPAGVVPKSVQRDMAAINAMQMNRSGSPDDRSNPIPAVPRGLSIAPPSSAQFSAMNNLKGAYQQPITHTAIASNDRLPELPPNAYVPFKPAPPTPPGVAAITAATTPVVAPIPHPVPSFRLPTVPVPGVTGPQPLTKFLPPSMRQNDTLTTAGNVAGNLIGNTPAGHLWNWLTGGPVSGGILGMIPAPHFAPPAAQAQGGIDPLQAAVLAAQRNGETYDRSRDPSFNPNGGRYGGSLSH